MGGLWQSAMLALARSDMTALYMQHKYNNAAIAENYLGGKNPVEAMDQAARLAEEGIKCSFHHLGSYALSKKRAEESLTALSCLLALLQESDVEGHISIDPTQLGSQISWQEFYGDIWPLAFRLQHSTKDRAGMHCLMINMEDYRQTQKTINIYNRMRADGFPVGITLQAYLKRSEFDLRPLVESASMVRLVKGSYLANRRVSYRSSRDATQNYQKLADVMLSEEAREVGFTPCFATHDAALLDYLLMRAKANRWAPGTYEIECLFGVGNELARRLTKQGETVRLFMPFGENWWPYVSKRIGGHPLSALTAMKRAMS